MTSYIIAGSSDKEEISVCENIARQIKSVYTDLEFNIILKHPSEWDDAIKEICKHYGLKSASNPIIFAKTGRPVGTVDDFIKLAEEKFGIDTSKLTNQIPHQVNVKIADDDYTERHRDKTLSEKIEMKYDQLLEKNKLGKLKGFYESKVDQGIEYFVKKSESLAPKIDVPLIVPYNYVKEPEYEEFEPNFCEGNIKLAEDPNNSQSINDGRPGSSPINLTKSRGADNIKTLPSEERSVLPKVLEENANEGGTHREKIEDSSPVLEGVDNTERLGSKESERLNTGLETHEVQEGEDPYEQQFDEEGNPIPRIEEVESPEEKPEPGAPKLEANFEVVDLKDYLVEDLEDNYYLSFHPNPLYEGQCLIFHDGREYYQEHYIQRVNLEEPGTYYSEPKPKKVLFDFSSCGRKDNCKHYSKSPDAIKKSKLDEHTSYLNKEEISVFDPLSSQDWAKVYGVVKNTDSIAFIQILPPGVKNYRPLSNGIVNIVPRQFLLKEYLNFGPKDAKSGTAVKLPFEKQIETAILPHLNKEEHVRHIDYVTLPNVPFKHKIGIIEDDFNGLSFKKLHLELTQVLSDEIGESLSQYGVNIIISKKWLYLIPVVKPYMVQRDTPIYLDPLIYLGFVIVPELNDVWPQTGKLDLDAKSWPAGKVLHYCSNK